MSGTATIAWSVMSEAERGVLFEHAIARLRGQDGPEPNTEGVVPTTPTWDGLSEAERERLITLEIAELRRNGLDRCFTKRPGRATQSQSGQSTLVTGNKGGIQMDRATVGQVETELAKPENQNVAALVNERTGAVHAFSVPKPYFARQDDGNDGASRGVPEVERRRQERDLRRELDKARKRLRGAPVADRATWEAKVEALETELRRLTAPRDEERDRQRSTTGDS